ncbi:MAG TPA: DUF1850 domain-containing protein [bacterium]|nr:DUF1850 domain-containing protein [bacterium]
MRKQYLFLLTLLILALVLLSVPMTYLTVEDDCGRLVLTPALGLGRRFSLKYRHSVEKTLCWEDFIVNKDGGLVLVATRYESLGVGLPFAVGEGELDNKEGQFHLTGLDRHFPFLSLRTMPVAEHALLVRGWTYKLTDFFTPGAMIRIEAQDLSLLQLLSYKLSKGEE